MMYFVYIQIRCKFGKQKTSPGKASRPGGWCKNNDIFQYATTCLLDHHSLLMCASHYCGNIPPWHTQHMGPKIAEEQDLKRWLLQEWNIPKHLLLKEFELIVPQLSIQILLQIKKRKHCVQEWIKKLLERSVIFLDEF